MHKITHVWEHVWLVTDLSSSTQILHLNLNMTTIGFDWTIWLELVNLEW
jgi:hypothetical protein